MGYLKASELGYEKAQANAAWILSQNQGIPLGDSATSYVQPGDLSSAIYYSAVTFNHAHGSSTIKLKFLGGAVPPVSWSIQLTWTTNIFT